MVTRRIEIKNMVSKARSLVSCPIGSFRGAGFYKWIPLQRKPSSKWRSKKQISQKMGKIRQGGAWTVCRGVEDAMTSEWMREGVLSTPVAEIATGIGSQLSLIYLGTLVTMLLGAAYVVVREVVVRVEMEEAIKRLGDNIREGNASSEEYFELAAVLIRKKLYFQAVKNLEKSIRLWDDDETELAQVYNAMGYCYFGLEKYDLSIKNYRKAVELRPDYVSAWNNLGDVYEHTEQWKDAYLAYKEALTHEADNKIAVERADFLKKKLERLRIPV